MKLIKSKSEMESMFIAGQKLAMVFSKISFSFCIGKTKKELDFYIRDLLDQCGMISQCFGHKKFSGYSCLSLNDELVHGVPDDKKIMETDLLKIDICASYGGFCADAARMYGFFENNSNYDVMQKCANESLNAGIDNVIVGNTVGCIGNAIENVIKKYKFAVVEDFAGHGIGKNMHEDPQILNYGRKKTGQKLYVGMAFAIEPMFCQFSSALLIDKIDGWTVHAKDGGLTGHIEDTVILTEKGVVVTTRLV